MSQPLIDQALGALSLGKVEEAEALARRAVDAAPDRAETWRALGLIHQTCRRYHDAFDAFERALGLSPEDDGVAAALSALASRVGMKDAALALAMHVAQRRPGDVLATVALGDALLALDHVSQACDLAETALSRAPDEPELIWYSGRAARAAGELDIAISLFEKVLVRRPNHPRLLYDLAWTLADAGRLDEAVAACDLALDNDPDPDARATTSFLRATVLLARGDLKAGWPAYASRNDPDLHGATRFTTDLPRWDGKSALSGVSILVAAEQGLGDELLFLGLMPDLLERVGPNGLVTLSVDARLDTLAQRSWPSIRLAGRLTEEINGQRQRSFTDTGEAKLWTPLGDLLPLLRADIEAFDQKPGYLKADPDRVAHWRRWLSKLPRGRKVGLAWRSGRMVAGRSRNFAALDEWRPILTLPGSVFVNLQYGDTGPERSALEQSFGARIHQPPGLDLYNDLDGLAALSSALDLVIGFSNASINIAGAVGAPLWLLTPPAPWTALGAPRYPWYPQAKRFTAPGYADWKPVMMAAATALS